MCGGEQVAFGRASWSGAVSGTGPHGAPPASARLPSRPRSGTGRAAPHPDGATPHARTRAQGAAFYRIIDQFIDQSGVNTESVFGGAFRDDRGGLALRHDRKGLLSMANAGPDTNTAHFSIMLGPAPHLNGHYTVFGQVVGGLDVVDAVNALSRGKPDNTATDADGAVIVDAGELRRGDIVPNLDQD